MINSSQMNSSKFEIWYRDWPQKLKKQSAGNFVKLGQKNKPKVFFPSEKQIELGHQIEFWKSLPFGFVNFLNSNSFYSET